MGPNKKGRKKDRYMMSPRMAAGRKMKARRYQFTLCRYAAMERSAGSET
jgi:hypothetical protein